MLVHPVDRISQMARQIHDAENKEYSATESGNNKEAFEAKSRALRVKRGLAKLDPRGYGWSYLPLLSRQEKEEALGVGSYLLRNI